MTTGRLEAFSDGVLAIALTIMVLELKTPHGADLAALRPLAPTMLSYVLSFIYIGIYWNNHHHLFQAAERVNGGVLWANLHLLFWLSLVPFATNWMGNSHFDTWPVVVYGAILLMAAVAYYVLVHVLIVHHPEESLIATAIGGDLKGKVSIALYVAGIGVAFLHPWAGAGVYAVVALIWLIPDRRIGKVVDSPDHQVRAAVADAGPSPDNEA